jgi:hypothetical protein
LDDIQIDHAMRCILAVFEKLYLRSTSRFNSYKTAYAVVLPAAASPRLRPKNATQRDVSAACSLEAYKLRPRTLWGNGFGEIASDVPKLPEVDEAM